MSLTEKVAFIRGLAEGLELDVNDKQVKVLNAIIDLLDEMALSVSEQEDTLDELTQQVDEIDDDLAEVEDIIYEDEEDDLPCDGNCEACDEDCAEQYYELTCPKCQETICIDEDMMDEGSMKCPNCGELLEFDLQEEVEE